MGLTIDEAKIKLDQAIDHLVEELKKLRTGRATANMLDGIEVEVYGQTTPLAHVATITVLDATTLQISPYDPNNLDAISNAIRDDVSRGLNPADDGRVVRVPVPSMTTERRQEVVKQLGEKVEQAYISMRNVRHDVLNFAKQQKNDKQITEDDYTDTDKRMSEMMEEHKKKIEELAKHKEDEILTV